MRITPLDMEKYNQLSILNSKMGYIYNKKMDTYRTYREVESRLEENLNEISTKKVYDRLFRLTGILQGLNRKNEEVKDEIADLWENYFSPRCIQENVSWAEMDKVLNSMRPA